MCVCERENERKTTNTFPATGTYPVLNIHYYCYFANTQNSRTPQMPKQLFEQKRPRHFPFLIDFHFTSQTHKRYSRRQHPLYLLEAIVVVLLLIHRDESIRRRRVREAHRPFFLLLFIFIFFSGEIFIVDDEKSQHRRVFGRARAVCDQRVVVI